jgi:hypothetical protein
VEVIPLTAEHVDLAAQLAKKLRESDKLCRLCLSPKATEPCRACGNQTSRQSRINDLQIAATVDCTADVEVLYTFDSWVLSSVAPLLERCTIRKPPHSAGELFESAEDEGQRERQAEIHSLPKGRRRRE